MSSAAGPPPPGGDVNLGPSLSALYLTLSIVAFLLSFSRVVVRLKDHHFGAEDFCSFMAAAIFVGMAGMVKYAASQGIYRHKYYLNLQQAELGLLTSTIGEGLIGILETFGKVAVALLFIRLMDRTGSSRRKLFLWVLIALTVVICIVTVFITFFQCRNPRALWNLALQKTTKCWDKSVLTNEAVFCSSWYTAVDFALALFPIAIVHDLKMSLRKKFALAFLLGLGVIAGIFCAVKTSLLPVLAHDSDASFQQYNLQVFTALEAFLLIALGCVPIFKRPMEYTVRQASQSTLVSSVRRLVGRTTIKSQGSNDSISGRYNYERHDNMAFPLQGQSGTSTSDVKTANVDVSEGVDNEGDRNGISVIKSYQVV